MSAFVCICKLCSLVTSWLLWILMKHLKWKIKLFKFNWICCPKHDRQFCLHPEDWWMCVELYLINDANFVQLAFCKYWRQVYNDANTIIFSGSSIYIQFIYSSYMECLLHTGLNIDAGIIYWGYPQVCDDNVFRIYIMYINIVFTCITWNKTCWTYIFKYKYKRT